MTTHQEARDLARDALTTLFGSYPELNEIRVLAGVGRLETGYGDGWKGPGAGSHNIGACQAGHSWKGATFTYTDTHPTAGGGPIPYQIAFRKYATTADGWLDFARICYVNCGRATVRTAAKTGDLHAVSTELHRSGYYEGMGATVEQRIANHCKALTAAVAAADAACRTMPKPVDTLDNAPAKAGIDP